MCYPCTGCNGCGKMDSKLFNYMAPRLRCINCDADYILEQLSCSTCGSDLPRAPGENDRQVTGEEETAVTSMPSQG